MKHRLFIRQRPLVCWALAYAAGLMAALNWAGFGLLLPLVGLAAGLLSAVLLRQQVLMRLLAILMAFFFLGVLLMGVALHPQLPAEGSHQVTGTVAGDSSFSSDGMRIRAVLKEVLLTGEDGRQTRVPRAYWTYYPGKDAALPQDGQVLRFAGQVLHPRGQVNPYGFDFRRHLLGQGIAVQINGARELEWLEPVRREPASLVLRARNSLMERMDQLFGRESALAKALLLGVKEGLEEEAADFRQAGIAHVLAVSGLHVGLLAIFLSFLLRPLHLSPTMRLILLSGLLFLYCVLLDFRPSVVRASILYVLYLTGRAFRRRVDPLSSLAAAFLLMLIIRPLDLLSAGFQLSFLAVLGIITLGDRLTDLLRCRAWFVRLPALMQNALLAYGITLSSSLMTLVPLVNHFHRFSLMGLLISPLAIAAIGIIMMGLLAVLLLSFPLMALALPLGKAVSCMACGYVKGVSLLADVPLAAIALPRLSPLFAGAYYPLLLLGTRYAALRKPLRFAFVGLLTLVLILVPLLPRDTSLRYVLLSSGFADSALILDGPHTTVIDTGEHAGDLLRLLHTEHRQIDRLIITHPHKDHMGGLAQILDSSIRVSEILLPAEALVDQEGQWWQPLLDQALQTGVPVRTLARGDVLASTRVRGNVRWPVLKALYPGRASNHGSLVIYWDLDGVSLLSAGDISVDYAPYAMAPAQVLKVAHHGSKADNPIQVLSLVKPQLALITASNQQADRYQASLERLHTLGAKTLVTGEVGAVTLRIKDGQIQVHTLQHREE